eukprot:GHVN01046396.1.p1 GENE.GHVN01046396.1~~GHVN01046396.1.p1  ORF type:complete len:104 (+),score=20.53 GHVN01046396.1:390-701(+)
MRGGARSGFINTRGGCNFNRGGLGTSRCFNDNNAAPTRQLPVNSWGGLSPLRGSQRASQVKGCVCCSAVDRDAHRNEVDEATNVEQQACRRVERGDDGPQPER